MGNFEKAMPAILKHEGSYQNDRSDSGNWTGGAIGKGELKGTKYGIAASQYPDLDIENLTLDNAIELYRKDYYRGYMDLMPYPIAAKLLDMTINAGHKQANVLLQRAVGVIDDGVIGHDTLTAINKDNPDLLLARYIGTIKRFYKSLAERKPEKAKFLKGWLARAEYVPTDGGVA